MAGMGLKRLGFHGGRPVSLNSRHLAGEGAAPRDETRPGRGGMIKAGNLFAKIDRPGVAGGDRDPRAKGRRADRADRLERSGEPAWLLVRSGLDGMGRRSCRPRRAALCGRAGAASARPGRLARDSRPRPPSRRMDRRRAADGVARRAFCGVSRPHHGEAHGTSASRCGRSSTLSCSLGSVRATTATAGSLPVLTGRCGTLAPT